MLTAQENDMNVEVEETGPCRKKLHIVIPAEKVDRAYKDLLNRFKKSVKIPGFRPGRAPDQLVEARYKKKMLEELRNDLIPHGYHDAIRQEQLDVVSVLAVEDLHLALGEPLRFNVMLDVPPAFELPDYRAIPLTAEDKEVEDEEIQNVLERMLDRMAPFEDITGRPVQRGDMIQVDYEGTIEGRPIGELDQSLASLWKAEGFWLTADQDSFLPGFGEQMIGVLTGDEKAVTVTFDETFSAKAVAGKQASYTATLTEIREKKRPELNDELFRQLKVASEDELRAGIKTDLKRAADHQERQRLKNEIVSYLLQHTNLDLPGSLVERETRNIIYDIVNRNASQGVSQDEIEKNKDEIFDTANRNAQERIKVRYILHRIADKEDIQVSEEEFNDYAGVLAARYRMATETFRAELKSRNAEDDVKEDLKNSKTFEFLLGQADVKRA